MRLIDADEIEWADHCDSDGNLSKYKIAFSNEMPPTVDAIPIEWMKEQEDKWFGVSFRGDCKIQAKGEFFISSLIEMWRSENETD